MDDYNPFLVYVLDEILFKGYTHSKRGSGLTKIPEKVLKLDVCEGINIKKEIKDIFVYHYKDKILSKKIYKWNWKNSWGFPEFLNQDGMLYWMPTTTYCIPRFCFETYKSSIENIKNFYEDNKDSNFIQIDFEAIMFHFLLKDKYFIETDWTCEGLGGVDGKLSVY